MPNTARHMALATCHMPAHGTCKVRWLRLECFVTFSVLSATLAAEFTQKINVMRVCLEMRALKMYVIVVKLLIFFPMDL